MRQLPIDIHEKIVSMCKRGDELVKLKDYSGGVKEYIAALKLIPGNPREWEAGTWIYVAMGDVHFELKSFDKAFWCFFNAVQSPGGLGNPYIHLRLGQLYFEGGKLDKAADELTRAYMGGSIDIFKGDDEKYLEFLKTKIIM